MAATFDISTPVTHCFLALARCGCELSVCSDRGVFEPDVIDFLRAGYTVTWVTVEEGKQRLIDAPLDCPHTPKWGKP